MARGPMHGEWWKAQLALGGAMVFCVLFYWAFGSALWDAILALGKLTGWW